MTFEEYARLGWWAQRRPSNLAAVWRESGRNWARLGVQKRAEICHEMADYFELPLWVQFFRSDILASLNAEMRSVRDEMNKS